MTIWVILGKGDGSVYCGRNLCMNIYNREDKELKKTLGMYVVAGE